MVLGVVEGFFWGTLKISDPMKISELFWKHWNIELLKTSNTPIVNPPQQPCSIQICIHDRQEKGAAKKPILEKKVNLLHKYWSNFPEKFSYALFIKFSWVSLKRKYLVVLMILCRWRINRYFNMKKKRNDQRFHPILSPPIR